MQTGEFGGARQGWLDQVQGQPDALHTDGKHQPFLEGLRNAAFKHAGTRSIPDRRFIRAEGPSTSLAMLGRIQQAGA